MASNPPRTRRARFSLADLTAGEPLSLDEVRTRFDGEWVLLLETAWDELQEPTHGHVLCHSKSRRDISKVLKQVDTLDARAPVYIFLAGPRIRTGEEARKFIAQLAANWTDKHAWWGS
jgi:hypothetical protein